MKKGSIRKEKRLAFLLRHNRDYAFDEHGWRRVDDLVPNHGFTLDEMQYIVKNINDQCFESSVAGQAICVWQGHFVNFDVELIETIPPECFYHGASIDNLLPVLDKGICKMNNKKLKQ